MVSYIVTWNLKIFYSKNLINLVSSWSISDPVVSKKKLSIPTFSRDTIEHLKLHLVFLMIITSIFGVQDASLQKCIQVYLYFLVKIKWNKWNIWLILLGYHPNLSSIKDVEKVSFLIKIVALKIKSKIWLPPWICLVNLWKKELLIKIFLNLFRNFYIGIQKQEYLLLMLLIIHGSVKDYLKSWRIS